MASGETRVAGDHPVALAGMTSSTTTATGCGIPDRGPLTASVIPVPGTFDHFRLLGRIETVELGEGQRRLISSSVASSRSTGTSLPANIRAWALSPGALPYERPDR
jgi:hypothetical protein